MEGVCFVDVLNSLYLWSNGVVSFIGVCARIHIYFQYKVALYLITQNGEEKKCS